MALLGSSFSIIDLSNFDWVTSLLSFKPVVKVFVTHITKTALIIELSGLELH